MDFRQDSRKARSLVKWAGAASLLVLAGCSRTAVPETQPVEPTLVVLEEAPPLVASTGELKVREAPRRVGDVFVHRFSGSYRGTPLMLREEVLSLHENVLTVDYVLEEGADSTHLRVQMAARSERILAVFRMRGEEEIPAAVADYERMIEKTLFVPDQNHGVLASKSETCLVGKTELDCDITEYEVSLNDQEAKLSVVRSDDVGRDVSGEVRAVDGTILYHAELLEMRRGEQGEQRVNDGLAMQEEGLFDER